MGWVFGYFIGSVAVPTVYMAVVLGNDGDKLALSEHCSDP